jgi:putative Ca2+/H+ antiporter (TMEM165/GDT1 family)
MVFLGSVSAYAVITALSVIIGSMLGKHIKPELVRYAGAVIFITIGILMFAGKL